MAKRPTISRMLAQLAKHPTAPTYEEAMQECHETLEAAWCNGTEMYEDGLRMGHRQGYAAAVEDFRKMLEAYQAYHGCD